MHLLFMVRKIIFLQTPLRLYDFNINQLFLILYAINLDNQSVPKYINIVFLVTTEILTPFFSC
jgi:hypothetical protein